MTKRKSTSKNSNGADIANGAKTDKKPKVSESTCDSTITEGVVEKWDLLYKIPKGDSIPCRLDGCKQSAVECWASNLYPDDKWNMCTECTEKEFGPPEDDPYASNPSDQVAESKDREPPKENGDARGQDTGGGEGKQDKTTTNTSSKSAPLEPEVCHDAPTTEVQSSTASITPSGGNGDMVEKWDMLYKIPLEDSIPCGLDGCQQSAVECWTCNLHPDDKWKMCVECTKKKFGPPEDDPNTKSCPTQENVVDAKEEQVAKGHKKERDDTAIKNEIKKPPTDVATVTDTDEKAKSDSENESSVPLTPSESISAGPEEKWDITRKIPEQEKVVCRIDGCNQLAVECWVSNLKANDEWNLCPACVEAEFGVEEPTALPETSINDLPINGEKPCSEATHLSPGIHSGDPHVTNSLRSCQSSEEKLDDKSKSSLKSEDYRDILPSAGVSTTKLARPVSPSNDLADAGTVHEDSTDSPEHVEEGWDMKKVMLVVDLSKESTIKCSTTDCALSGAVVYLSTKTKQKWYCCIDCQEIEFGGWPDKLVEIPIDSMTESHKRLMVQKCSSQASLAFPSFFQSPIKSSITSVNLTPPPNESKQVTPTPGSKKAKPSAQAMAIHRKWQAAAEAMGGPDARIVVEKKAAKKMIFDLLYDSFCPMNITQIHSALKALVPSPVLKQCLDDMSMDKEGDMFIDSDDEDNVKKSKKGSSNRPGDSFAEVLIFKSGRSSNASLYYMDHTKQKNNGDGLEIEARNELYSKKALAEQDEAQLRNNLVKMEADTKQLNSEPTNEDAATKLETDEVAIVELRGKLDEARKLRVNEKVKHQTKRRIENMVTQWRKRRRLCMDFLISMEENTDGMITVKKCLKGDGQIDIESDSKAIQDAKTYAVNKKLRKTKHKAKVRKTTTKSTDLVNSSGILADEKFIGVELSTQGTVSRVYLDEDE